MRRRHGGELEGGIVQMVVCLGSKGRGVTHFVDWEVGIFAGPLITSGGPSWDTLKCEQGRVPTRGGAADGGQEAGIAVPARFVSEAGSGV